MAFEETETRGYSVEDFLFAQYRETTITDYHSFEMAEVTTFLLVEDDPNDVQLLRIEFQRSAPNLHLMAVNDGSEAIDYLEGRGQYQHRREYPLPHVILLDLKMPRIGGFDFLKWLRSKSPNNYRLIPVIVMSSSGLTEDVDRAYALGANSYMVKPIDWNLFKERIKTVGLYWAEHVKTPVATSSPHKKDTTH